MAPDDFPPTHLVHFQEGTQHKPSRALLQFFLYLGTLTHLTAQVRETLYFLQCLALQCDGWLVPYLSVLTSISLQL